MLPGRVHRRLCGLWRKGLGRHLRMDLRWHIACRILKDWSRRGLGSPCCLVCLLLFLHLAKHVLEPCHVLPHGFHVGFGLCFGVKADLGLYNGERGCGRRRLRWSGLGHHRLARRKDLRPGLECPCRRSRLRHVGCVRHLHRGCRGRRRLRWRLCSSIFGYGHRRLCSFLGGHVWSGVALLPPGNLLLHDPLRWHSLSVVSLGVPTVGASCCRNDNRIRRRTWLLNSGWENEVY
ncbi:Os05g0279750 [Oryza sativa Japonica Group]|uniref:Os05g0279750 protein n=1 Tax=Oryza sativa subsp. japonica TaxID=39947 RepID=A0A0P0WK47_ORYSJ|nr:hypothetical protein EE612_028329 [Oryza sativa]BAS93133.1 Os05g0279750 [Oryza sativa Japonica Group]